MLPHQVPEVRCGSIRVNLTEPRPFAPRRPTALARGVAFIMDATRNVSRSLRVSLIMPDGVFAVSQSGNVFYERLPPPQQQGFS